MCKHHWRLISKTYIKVGWKQIPERIQFRYGCVEKGERTYWIHIVILGCSKCYQLKWQYLKNFEYKKFHQFVKELQQVSKNCWIGR